MPAVEGVAAWGGWALSLGAGATKWEALVSTDVSSESTAILEPEWLRAVTSKSFNTTFSLDFLLPLEKSGHPRVGEIPKDSEFTQGKRFPQGGELGGSPPASRRAVPGRPRALGGRKGEGGGYSPGSRWRPKLARSGSE